MYLVDMNLYDLPHMTMKHHLYGKVRIEFSNLMISEYSLTCVNAKLMHVLHQRVCTTWNQDIIVNITN